MTWAKSKTIGKSQSQRTFRERTLGAFGRGQIPNAAVRNMNKSKSIARNERRWGRAKKWMIHKTAGKKYVKIKNLVKTVKKASSAGRRDKKREKMIEQSEKKLRAGIKNHRKSGQPF